jgi:hypothetical protein
MEVNMIQLEGKGGEVAQFSQFGECRDVRELLSAITRMKWNVIHTEAKGGEVAQFPQFLECRDVRELLIANTRNGVEFDTDQGQEW